MGYVDNLIGLGMAPELANLAGNYDLINQPVPKPIKQVVAAGTDQATALQLDTMFTINTATALNTGVRLSEKTPIGGIQLLFNQGASNAVSVFPPIGHSLNSLSTNSGISVSPGRTVIAWRITSVLWNVRTLT